MLYPERRTTGKGKEDALSRASDDREEEKKEGRRSIPSVRRQGRRKEGGQTLYPERRMTGKEKRRRANALSRASKYAWGTRKEPLDKGGEGECLAPGLCGGITRVWSR